MFDEIIDFDVLTENDGVIVQFENATFKKDFGPFKKDDVAYVLAFDLDEGTLTEYDGADDIVRQCKIEFAVKV